MSVRPSIGHSVPTHPDILIQCTLQGRTFTIYAFLVFASTLSYYCSSLTCKHPFHNLHIARSLTPRFYRSIISVTMTSLFIWPLVRHSFRHSQLRHIARRSVTAASIALTTSCANISVLAAMGGVEYGWLLLLFWEADVSTPPLALYSQCCDVRYRYTDKTDARFS